jgi:hypothetical protein
MQSKTNPERLRINDVVRQWRIVKELYGEVSSSLTALENKPTTVYSIEAITPPEIRKSNRLKRYAPILLVPMALTGGLAFLLLLYDAYRKYRAIAKAG